MTTDSFVQDSQFFFDLHDRVERAGLFKPVYLTYIRDAIIWFSLLGLCVHGVVVLPHWWERSVLMALGATVVLTQISYFAHDAGHRELVPGNETANICALLVLTCFLGISGDWWTKAHDAHHRDPNHETKDPNLRVGVLTFSENQGTGKFRRFQAWYYVPGIALETILMKQESIKHILKKGEWTWLLELFGMGVYFVTHFGFLIFLSGLSWWEVIIFTLVHQLTLGLYLGMAFAPNHKGMRVVHEGEELGFLEKQLTTTRNVRPGRLTDVSLGGLNYQVEHHLFPHVPRYRLGALRKIVKPFCEEHGLFYYETSLWASYGEMFRFFQTAGRLAAKTVSYVWAPKVA